MYNEWYVYRLCHTKQSLFCAEPIRNEKTNSVDQFCSWILVAMLGL